MVCMYYNGIAITTSNSDFSLNNLITKMKTNLIHYSVFSAA